MRDIYKNFYYKTDCEGFTKIRHRDFMNFYEQKFHDITDRVLKELGVKSYKWTIDGDYGYSICYDDEGYEYYNNIDFWIKCVNDNGKNIMCRVTINPETFEFIETKIYE